MRLLSDYQDKHLGEKLKEELPGILKWAIQGYLVWQKDGLGVPEEVKAATESYRTEMDDLGSFLTERCFELEMESAKASDLYAAYKEWCESNGERPSSQRALGMRLTERGFQRRRGTGGPYYWHGIGLRTLDSEPMNHSEPRNHIL